MAESNTPLPLRVPLCLPSFPFFPLLFPFFSPLFPFFFLLLSENRTHRYREIAIFGYCTNTVGVQLTGGETKQQAYNSLEISVSSSAPIFGASPRPSAASPTPL
jgi:hypothetical protein